MSKKLDSFSGSNAPTCSGSCVIDPWDLVKFPASMLGMNPILALAAKHGCPSDGVLYPKHVEGIRYTRINHANGTIELRWDSCQNANVDLPDTAAQDSDTTTEIDG